MAPKKDMFKDLAAEIGNKTGAQSEKKAAGQMVENAHKVVTLIPRSEINITDQVRKKYNDASIRELADSIAAMGEVKGDKFKGLLQAITVGPKGADGKRLVTFGHRRFLATGLLNWELVPCVIDDSSRDSETSLIAVQLVENLQREDNDLLEVALGLAKMRELGMKSGDIAKVIGRNNSFVSKHLKIAAIPMAVLLELAKIATKDLEALYGFAGLMADDEQEANKLLTKAVTDGRLIRADVVAVQDRVRLNKRKAALPSAEKIEAGIKAYYLAEKNSEPLTFDVLRERLGVEIEDHEIFVAAAHATFERLTRDIEIAKANTAEMATVTTAPATGDSSKQTPPVSQSEISNQNVPEKPAQTLSETKQEQVHVEVTTATKNAQKEPSGKPDSKVVELHIGKPMVRVNWARDDEGLGLGYLVLDGKTSVGMTPEHGNAFVMTEDGCMEQVPMDELTIIGISYA